MVKPYHSALQSPFYALDCCMALHWGVASLGNQSAEPSGVIRSGSPVISVVYGMEWQGFTSPALCLE